MSFFLMRGWNTAIPDVDRGDDVFVVKDDDGRMQRVQVKTAVAKVQGSGFRCRYSVKAQQIIRELSPELTFVFCAWNNGGWLPPVVVDRQMLWGMYDTRPFGKVARNGLVRLDLIYQPHENKVTTHTGNDLSQHINQFSQFTLIRH